MKVDLKKSLDSYRARQGEFRLVDLPPMTYLMVDGHGDPGSTPEFGEAFEALYPVAYTLKFASKLDLDRDYVVPPMEGLWWADDMTSYTTERDPSRWDWTLMLLVPDWITAEMIDAALAAVAAKKDPPVGLDRVRAEVLEEGRCVQTLHVGPYDAEGPVLAEMHDVFIPGEGLRMTGKHHEIYLSDPRRVEAAKLRTILRQPVA